MEMISQLLPFVILIGIMYFIIIRPQQKEAKTRKEMIESLSKGDKVVTAGGMIVVIQKVEEKFLSVKINDDTLIKVTKDSVIRKFEDEA
jgi:preprotein translocase subunit YajC